jgi:gliding motility-associated-like protein
MIAGYQQFNFSGYLGFTASTAGYTDNQSIKNVKVYTEMPPSFAGNDVAVCPGDTVSLGGDSNPGYSYSWLPSKGLSDTTSSAPFLQLENDSANSQIYTYYVKTAFTSNPGCASMDSVKIKVYPKPKINFVTPEICLHDALALFTDSTYTEDNSTLPFNYLWNFGDPGAGTANPNTSSLQNPSHHYSAANNYTVGLEVSNSKGCTDSLTKIFTVNGAVPTSAFTVNNAEVLCSNKAVQLANQSSVDFGTITKVEFFWGDSSGLSFVDEKPYPGKLYDHQFPSISSSADTTFAVKMVAFSGISCQNASTQTVKILRAPQIQFTPIAAVCSNSSPFSIINYASVADLQGTFSYGGTGVLSNGMFNPKLADSTLATILYAFTATNSCVDSVSQPITIIPAPVVNTGPDLYLLKNESGQILATASGSELTYSWYPALYLNDQTILQPTSTPMDDITYTLTVTGTGGCKDSSQVAVKILPEPQIPNAFTPNNDGLNDTWGIPYLNLYENCDVKIYNRYGQLVFHSQGYKQPWDGTFKGERMPAGSYVYFIDPKRGKKLYKGILTLIR